MQLPPVVLNNNAEYLKTSLFENLIIHYKHKSQELLIQYRMNEILMKYPNMKFYENKLHNVMQKLSVDGSIIGPPADIEYAVEPVGVAAIRPSAR